LTVPYFQCCEFLENNSIKSGWPAAHKQSGKVGYAVMSFGGLVGIGEEFYPTRCPQLAAGPGRAVAGEWLLHSHLPPCFRHLQKPRRVAIV
jgi:hypothetical protein